METAVKKEKVKTLKVKILLPVAGKFKMTQDVGKIYNIEAKQAQELIDAKYAELVKTNGFILFNHRNAD